MTFLLCDIGNTRMKTVVLGADADVNEIVTEDVLAVDARELSATRCREIFQQQRETVPDTPIDTVWLSCVRDGETMIAKVASDVLGARVGFARVTFAAFNMSSDYDVASLGVDRFLAMLGAREIGAGRCVVADCGTAVTIDLLDASGHHEGGLILPGLAMMRRGLHAGSDHLPLLDDTAGVGQVLGKSADNSADKSVSGDVLARDTQSAMARGCCYAIRCAIEAAAREYDTDMVIITGGDAEQICHAAWQHEPHLVLTGLARYARHMQNHAEDEQQLV